MINPDANPDASASNNPSKSKKDISSDNITLSALLEIKLSFELGDNPSIYSKENLMQVLETFRTALYYNSSKLSALSSSLPLINDIIDSLLLCFHKFDSDKHSSLLSNVVFFLERAMYLFLFHFQIEIIHSALKILSVLLKEVDYDFHKDTLVLLIKILYILKVKKTVNNLVCSKMMSNFSLAVVIILNKTNQETKKLFIDFVNENYKDYIVNFILCGGCNNDINYSKLFAIDTISAFIEKNTKDIDKLNQVIESSIQNMKTEKSLSLKTKIRQTVDLIGCICKVIDSFNIKDNKTYNYDKVIKNTLTPTLRKFWNLILFIQDTFFYEIDLTLESIQSVILLTENINSLSFDLLLPLLNWIGLFLDKNVKYIVNARTVVNLISKCEIPKETSVEISNVIIEMLERVLTSDKEKKDPILKYYVILIIDSLEKLPGCCPLEFKEEIIFTKEIYLSIREGKLIESISVDDEICNNAKSSFELYMKEYINVLSYNYIYSTKASMNNSFNGENSTIFKNTLDKYDEFKDSLKTLYGLESSNLLIDNKINNFREKEVNTSELRQSFESFYLESSIEMFREIFSLGINNKKTK